MSKKGVNLIPKIIGADTNSKAIEVLHDVLKELHLNSDYTDLVDLKDKLDSQRQKFEELTDSFGNGVKEMDVLTEMRTNLNFLYRDVSDLSFEINKNKIYFEEYKTVARATSIKELKNNKEFLDTYGIKSVSGIRDVVGQDDGYKQFVNLSSISYGLFKDLDSLLVSIRQWIDLVAIMMKNEQIVIQKDAK